MATVLAKIANKTETNRRGSADRLNMELPLKLTLKLAVGDLPAGTGRYEIENRFQFHNSSGKEISQGSGRK
jgi:hypothetical protein